MEPYWQSQMKKDISILLTRQPKERPLHSHTHSRRIIIISHEGPIWEIAWADPVYGNIIATAGFDQYIKLWQFNQGAYKLIHN